MELVMILIIFWLPAGKNNIIVVVIIVVVIIVVVLLLALLPAVYIIAKKHFSHFTKVDQNVREDLGEEPATERTGFLQENLPPSFDASAVLSQQLCNAEPLGAGETGENSSVRVSFGLVVFYIKKTFLVSPGDISCR